ncbi:MAG: hypothetical protein NC395_06085 [Prevotella sp.]|nr:hypothetical protein [Prevotella sp.]
MLEIIIIVIVIAIVWSIIKAIFSGIADVIKEHPKGTVTFLFVAVIGGLSVYGYYIGEFNVEELIFGIVGSFVFIKLVLWAITLLVKIFFAIRRSMIISGIKGYFRSVNRTISYSSLRNDVNRQYGGKKLDLKGTEYSDKYIEEEMSIFTERNRADVKDYAVKMVNDAGKMSLEKAVSTLISNRKNYCIGDWNLDSFVDSVLREVFQRKKMDDGGVLYLAKSENRKADQTWYDNE